ncbi:hypothetical protein Acr_01g0010420 [Actinidia rufa]|uniref:Uncharacterized protein n=1 Tax=Actinidia rufa TaxID=165716 RepID=A0A7J0E3Z9_9ERIC|nr:hypothetical protein Acr_01g0010420 [Actinidia rufa]
MEAHQDSKAPLPWQVLVNSRRSLDTRSNSSALEVGGEDLEAVVLGEFEGVAVTHVAGVPGGGSGGGGVVGVEVEVDVAVEVVDVEATAAVELGDLKVGVGAYGVPQGLLGVEE